ncbi:MAG TPA: TonB family protein [Anaeromyxobacteraceae bacterium]|nr:TonB family protein [Anaeromyxobacteraceae bacterium]
MAQRFQSALSRRDRIWPAALISLAFHAGAIAFAMARASAPEIDLEQKPIVAKLVRLGPERPKQLLPRKEEPPPAPAAADPEPVPVPTAAPPAAPAPAVATKPVPSAPAPRASAKPSPAPARSSGRTLSSVLDRVRTEAAREQEQYGSPDGDPLGDASEGEEGDRYLALVKRALDDNWTAPAVISERDLLHLRAEIVLFIEPDGRIDRFAFERRSGNAAFDAALERTVRTTRVPPPPPEMRDAYRRRGITVRFPPS